MSVPTFVVGAGRCGPTMLSNMLREHPDILSLSEFLSMVSDGEQLRAAGFRVQNADGRAHDAGRPRPRTSDAASRRVGGRRRRSAAVGGPRRQAGSGQPMNGFAPEITTVTSVPVGVV